MCCGAPSSFMWLGFSKSCSASPQVSCCAVATALVVASLLYTSFKLQPVTQHLTLSPHVSYFSLRARSAHPVWMMPINWRSAEQQATCAHVIGYMWQHGLCMLECYEAPSLGNPIHFGNPSQAKTLSLYMHVMFLSSTHLHPTCPTSFWQSDTKDGNFFNFNNVATAKGIHRWSHLRSFTC